MKRRRSLPSVARSRRFQQALSRRLRIIDRNLAAALDQDVEALHRTRVASRRLREALPLLSSPGTPDGLHARKSRGRVRRLTRALGGVREMDVALAILEEIRVARPEVGPTIAEVRVEVTRERAERYARMIRSLDEVEPEILARDLERLSKASGPSGGEARGRLRERVERRSHRLDAAVEQAGSLYAFDRLHIVRIAAKKLRYALELVEELAALGTRRLVSRLKQAQDLLGRLHDLEVVAAFVRRVAGRGPKMTAAAGKILDVIDAETRQLHARYLAEVTVLRTVAAAARDEVAPRLKRVSRRAAR